jgi:outer membrane protein assembly factor BamB
MCEDVIKRFLCFEGVQMETFITQKLTRLFRLGGWPMIRLTGSVLSLLVMVSLCLGGDWPQWLGPNRDCTSPEKIAPWKEAPKALWKKAVGEGHSSPVVANGKVFLHYRVPSKNEEAVAAFDAKSGEMLWEKSYPRSEFSSIFGLGPRGTPTIDGDRIYTLGVTGVLTCWKISDGKQLWQHDLLRKFEAKNLFFGISTSPLVEEDRVTVMVGGKGASVVCFDKMSGEFLWKTGDDPASYSSPILAEVAKKKQSVFLTGANLIGVSSKGDILWKHPFKDELNESSITPVKFGDYILGSSVKAGTVCIRVTEKEGKFETEEVWKNKDVCSYFTTPVKVGPKHFYVVTGEARLLGATATLHCVDITDGKVAWSKPKVGRYHAGLMTLGDGKVLMMDDNGFLTLMEPSTEKYTELARSKICGLTWAHPALADGRLFIRDDKELLCVDPGK